MSQTGQIVAVKKIRIMDQKEVRSAWSLQTAEVVNRHGCPTTAEQIIA
jgi:hypothetical protein